MKFAAPGRHWPAILALAVYALLAASPAGAAPIDPTVQADLRRGLATVGDKASDEPALRLERQTHEPSPGFALGSALGAWRNAAAALDFDLKNPAGDGDDSEAIANDCFDEKTAFAHLQSRAQSLGLTPDAVVAAAGLPQASLLDAWRARLSGPARRCAGA